MNAERLLARYESIADGPDAIARLRRFILDLAVRGRLVPQDPSDEPASELLSRLSAIPSHKVESRRRGRRAVTAAGLIEEPPYQVSSSWVWAQMGGLGETNVGLTYSPSDICEDGYPVLRSNNIQGGKIDLSQLVRVRNRPKDSVMVRQGDMLICARNGSRALVGKAAIIEEAPEPMAFGAFMAIFRSPINSYLHLFVSSPVFRQVIDEVNTNTINQITQANLQSTLVPLPPLAEQHRIVAKVDELMALCDRLEAARGSREATRDRLTAASLARLNAPDPATFHDDARFALDALPALTTRPDQIKHLRQTILNLAVRGKLVPQDPTDEPAPELLRRIAKAKAERKKKTGDARIKIVPDPMPDELEMPFPHGWAAQSFENLFLFIDYRGNTPPKTDEGIPLITAKNIRMGYLNREPREYISQATFETWMTRGFPEIGDLFFTTEAPLANICLYDIEEPFALAQRAICFQPYARIDTKFLMFALMSDVMQSLIDKHATGMTAKGIKAAKLKPLPIPVPPLAEQHRIVAKVNSLMALCDLLEASLTASAATRRRLLDALLAEAVSPVDARELMAAE